MPSTSRYGPRTRSWPNTLAGRGLRRGFRTLDLTSRADQPGFISTATASEDEGYDGANVKTLTVALGGSGAVDDLVHQRGR